MHPRSMDSPAIVRHAEADQPHRRLQRGRGCRRAVDLDNEARANAHLDAGCRGPEAVFRTELQGRAGNANTHAGATQVPAVLLQSGPQIPRSRADDAYGMRGDLR